ncbi:HNH endonuclease signature motif containing protein [Corynebacterium timonense]|uniref:HNH endonuclease n=1 Tax=Corynebacterium timonense TaxID=441500 RepID=A0A1H1UB27_9CORY|nr:HNH endonuclease signature motif containing protein [Corynebacterium timonense]SDS69685.1 HNH endonuclease [Corynebacterium timonense]
MSTSLSTPLGSLVDAITSATSDLSAIFSTPDDLTFGAVRADMERLYASLDALAAIDAAYAYLADRDGAGEVVGANHATQYFVDVLGLSRAEARSRITRGHDLYGEPVVPDIPADSEPTPERERAREKRLERARRARAAARSRAGAVSAEKHKVIQYALRDLNEHATPGYDELHAEALAHATGCGPEELRRWLRDNVRRANLRGRDYDGEKDPHAAWKKRSISFGRPDADGLGRVTLQLARGEMALLKALIEPGYAPGTNVSTDPAEDTRTRAQRGHDQLVAILHSYEHGKQQRGRGAASVVLSLTAEDLTSSDRDTLFATNTGIDLDAHDILRLGLSGTDFILELDPVTALPLSLGRTRLASVGQKLALLATQGVCAWAGCDRPGMELEGHHIVAWKNGGLTDISNLAGLCREHHRCVNDDRDGARNKGHVDINRTTGRVEHHPADGSPPRTNETHGYRTSAGARIRHRAGPAA